MARIIAVLSGKGGVGKSTITANLAHAFTQLGENTIALDSNLTTPHLGLHLGMHLVPKTLHDVLRGDANLENTIYFHPSGFRVVPASMNVNDLIGVEPERLIEVAVKLSGKCDVLLLDSAPGLGKEAVSSMQAADEVLLVTNPNLSSVVDALKTLKIAEGMGKKILGVVVNRISGDGHEMSRSDIENLIGMPILSEIPEDRKIGESMALKIPVMAYRPDAPSSMEIKKLAHILSGREIQERKNGLFGKMFKWAFG